MLRDGLQNRCEERNAHDRNKTLTRTSKVRQQWLVSPVRPAYPFDMTQPTLLAPRGIERARIYYPALSAVIRSISAGGCFMS
jgi:hypothetical protein